MITTTSSSHFYTREGEPRYEVTGKNGKLRPTTLADARKHGWLPSVTTYAKVFPADGLRNWLREQDILAAITTPRLPRETDEEFIAKVLQSAEEESTRAAEKGTRRHALCEELHRAFNIGMDGEWQVDSGDIPFIMPYVEWFRSNVSEVIDSEFVAVHSRLGYAGRVDLCCRLNDGSMAIVDLKNRKRLAVYDGDVIQLAAYAQAIGQKHKSISAVLGTEKPELLIKEWSTDEINEGWTNFELCRQLWNQSRRYWPS
jgi:hypothetical protein